MDLGVGCVEQVLSRSGYRVPRCVEQVLSTGCRVSGCGPVMDRMISTTVS